MTSKYNMTSFVSFMIGYLLLYYVILWLAATVFDETIAYSWVILGDDMTKMQTVLIVSPFIGAIFGTWVASVSIMSYTAMGSDRLGPSKFFMFGWLCFMLSNMMTLSAALQLFVEEKIGQEWIEYLGKMKFNACFFLLAPSFGFAGGVTAVILLSKLIEAQKS